MTKKIKEYVDTSKIDENIIDDLQQSFNELGDKLDQTLAKLKNDLNLDDEYNANI